MEGNPTLPPSGWLEALAQSDAEVAAGLTIPAQVVHQGLRDSIARLAASAKSDRQRGAPSRD